MKNRNYTIFQREDAIQVTPANPGWHAMFASEEDAATPYHAVPIACWAIVPVTARDFRTNDSLQTQLVNETPIGTETVGLCPPGPQEGPDLTIAGESANFVCYCPPGEDHDEYWERMTSGICSECLAGRHENCLDNQVTP